MLTSLPPGGLLLFQPRVTAGRDPIRERMVRPVMAEPDWRKQRRMWKGLLITHEVDPDFLEHLRREAMEQPELPWEA